MTDNATNLGGIEVYLHDIYYFTDEFIRTELGGAKDLVHDNFSQMILYIADRIQKPDNADAKLLDKIFDIYVRLCTKFQILPTLEMFSMLVKINRATFYDWSAGQYRKSTEHGDIVKKWHGICKNFVVDRLHNSRKVDPNLIFIAKAGYGMVEASPAPILEVETQNTRLPCRTREEIMASYGDIGIEADREFPEPPEWTE